MSTKRIVISGGPGSGKTSLINHLEEEGYTCLHEISRQVILEAQQNGIAQLFLENPMLFSEKLLEGRLEQFLEVENHQSPFVFFDRGMPDVTAYMDYIKSHYPPQFERPIRHHTYDAIFLLPPWEEIYIQDNERYEDFSQAETIYEYLVKGYEKYDYEVNEVPVGDIPYRTEIILDTLKKLF